MVFSPRILKGIWNVLREEHLVIGYPPDPSVEAFLAHYAAADTVPGFSWSDQLKGVTYTYDVTINQVQVEPYSYPCSWFTDDANKALWKLLPPRLLEEPVNWTQQWTEAAKAVDLGTMRFILEQGFDWRTLAPSTDWEKMWFMHPYQSNQVDAKTMEFILEQGFNMNNFLRPADWTKTWFMAAGVGDVEAMKVVLGQGFDVNKLDQRGKSALWYAAGYYGGRYNAVTFLLDAGIHLGSVDELIQEGQETVTCRSEASEQRKIAKYLLQKAQKSAGEG